MAPMTALGQTKAPAKARQSAPKRTAPATAKKPAKPKPDDMAWLQEAMKDPELMKAAGHLMERLSNELQSPAPRTQSRILPRLSDSTVFYGAFPNYGPVLRQALQIWQQELHDSAALKNFLQKNKLDANEPKAEEVVQKLIEFSDYLGDELVITAGMRGKEPSGVLVAEVRKPGLTGFLAHVDELLTTDSKQHLRVFDPQQLQTATDQPGELPTVLVRPDFVVIGTSAAALREFNAQLDKSSSSFSASALGKRLAQSYQGGTSGVFGADLQKLIGLIPKDTPQSAQIMSILNKTGFGDARYALMESKSSGKNSNSEMELVFSGPRHGVASWIASSAPLGSVDFMSPKAAIVEAFRLKSPAQILDDIVELAGPSAMQMLPQMEAQFNVNLKQDILSKLGGEIGFEIESLPTPPPAGSQGMAAAQPNFKLILSVTDGNGLQQTIKRLMAQGPFQAQERMEDGITFYSVAPPSAAITGQEFNYFFLDGYLVVTTSRELARETVSLHRSGTSLAHTQAQPVKASMFVRQNANFFLASMLSQLPPDVARQLPKMLTEAEPTVNTVYGYADETSLRATTNSSTQSYATMGLIVAAVAIPNLLRSKMAANEAAAAATMRTINTAEMTYKFAYPSKGYASSLAAMGPGAGGDCSDNVNAAHACLLDETLGGANCTSGKWCIKSGYKFSVRGICTPAGTCSGYVATATPVTAGSTGTKSFCSTVDAVIRSKEGAVDAPLTSLQCKAWKAIQ
jgi:type II secretory pathway pseudopilin PulG